MGIKVANQLTLKYGDYHGYQSEVSLKVEEGGRKREKGKRCDYASQRQARLLALNFKELAGKEYGQFLEDGKERKRKHIPP